MPADWKGKRVLLHFGAVDYRAAVWVNGRTAGEHEGGSVPFPFDITPLAEDRARTPWSPCAPRIRPPTATIPRGKQYWEPKSRSIFYTRTSGIWQTVWLEAAGAELPRARCASRRPTTAWCASRRGVATRARPGVARHASEARRRWWPRP